MKVVVMGAGIIGITSAYFLAKNGHEVTVIDKNSKAAMSCSMANGGQLSFSHIEPFSSKSSVGLILKSLFTPSSFSSIENYKDKKFLNFCFNFLKNYGNSKTRKISKNLLLLGEESRLSLNLILKEENIDFCYSKSGILHFYKNKKLFQKAMKQAEFQVSLGDKIDFLTPDQCVEKEPTLIKIRDEGTLLGGIFHKNDAMGDANIFAQKLAEICRDKYGVKFHYNTEIRNILTNHKKITGINTDRDVYSGDKYIFALGAYGQKLLKGVKLNNKIFPIRGYSLSIPCGSEFIAPNIGLTDPENKIVYSRLGNIFRAAGTVEISSQNRINNNLISFIKNKIHENFSDYGNMTRSEEWKGIRPFRANSIPLIKKCEKYENLFFNCGHGHLGWSMSFGSAKIISDLVNGRINEKFRFLDKEKCF